MHKNIYKNLNKIASYTGTNILNMLMTTISNSTGRPFQLTVLKQIAENVVTENFKQMLRIIKTVQPQPVN